MLASAVPMKKFGAEMFDIWLTGYLRRFDIIQENQSPIVMCTHVRLRVHLMWMKSRASSITKIQVPVTKCRVAGCVEHILCVVSHSSLTDGPDLLYRPTAAYWRHICGGGGGDKYCLLPPSDCLLPSRHMDCLCRRWTDINTNREQWERTAMYRSIDNHSVSLVICTIYEVPT